LHNYGGKTGEVEGDFDLKEQVILPFEDDFQDKIDDFEFE